MHLGFMWLSERCTADGQRIRSHISKHQKDKEEYKPTLTKPHKPEPNTASWKIIDRVIQSPTTADEATLLDSNAVGNWTENHRRVGH